MSTDKKDQKKKRKWLIAGLYLVLFIIIGIVLWETVYTRSVNVELTYGEEPGAFLNLAEKYVPDAPAKKVEIFFLFNNLPAIEDIENIAKIHLKHRADVHIAALFHKKFKPPVEMTFPHKFLTGQKIEAFYNDRVYNENYFILLDERKVKHVQESPRVLDLNFLIEKHLNPGKDYENYRISTAELKTRIIKRLQQGSLRFLNLESGDIEDFENLDNITGVYVIIAECSSCELKSIVSDLKLRQIFAGGNILVIFPVHANESQLAAIIKKEKLNLPIFHDRQDQLDLFSLITNPKDKMIAIEGRELRDTGNKEIFP